MSAYIVDLDVVVKQAWAAKGKEALRLEVESQLRQARDKLVRQMRGAGQKTYSWGYTIRKSLLSSWGDLGPIRLPRLRSENREIRLIPKQLRRLTSFDWVSFHEVAGGVSQRKACRNLQWRHGITLSAPTMGSIVKNLGQEVLLRRHSAIAPYEYTGLAVDGIWGNYRGAGKAVLLLAMGVRPDGSFAPLDWEAGTGESLELARRLYERLWHRGLQPLRLIVSDGAEAFQQARQWVYPEAQGQLCLWHWERTLIRHVSWEDKERFDRDYWEVYGGLDLAEVRERAKTFKAHWRRRAPEVIRQFSAGFGDTIAFVRHPALLRKRLRTVNLAEGFFKNFRRFLSRYPGLLDEEHFCRCLGVYLLSASPEVWCPRRLRAAV